MGIEMNFLKKIVGILSFLAICIAIVTGVLYPSEAWFSGSAALISIVLLLVYLFLNRQNVWRFLSKKSTHYGANMALLVFLVLGILVFINILGKQFSWRKDLTRSGVNSLSQQTVKVLHDLREPVLAVYFARPQEKEKAEALLKNYAYESKKFKYEIVDPNREPTKTKAMGVTKFDTLVLQLDKSDSRKIMVEGSTEEKLTNGLIRLFKSQNITVYFTQGHGEPLISDEASGNEHYSQLRKEIEKEAYIAKPLNLVAEGKIPSDASVLVISGPRSAFFPKEIELIKNYLAGGGKVIVSFLLDISNSGLSAGSKQIAALLTPYGVQVNDKMLVDPTSRAANVEPQVLMAFSADKEHPIVRDFPTSNMQIVPNFLFPVTVNLSRSEVAGVKQTQIVKTTAQAWAESDWKGLKSGKVGFDAGKDNKGVMDLAIALEEQKSKARIVAFATSFFPSNAYINIINNKDLFLNSLAWLSNNDDLISIRAKTEDDTQALNINQNWINFIFLLVVLVIPLGIISLGIWIWWRRRGR
jgi:ABC-type uncharacterized transport system involved in gliding motility auxiliary subunit